MIGFRATLLKPLDQQHDRQGDRIDPAGVRFDPEADFPVWREFGYRVPEDWLGTGKISREPDGSLVITGWLKEGAVSPNAVRKDTVPPLVAAIGVKTEGTFERSRDGLVIEKSEIMSVALTSKHVDPTQPPIEIKEKKMIDKAEIEKRFTHHRPDATAEEKHNWARAAFLAFAEGLADELPDSREKSLAFTALEEASFWAHAAVARAGR